MIPHLYVWCPHMYDMIFSGQLCKSPLCVLNMTLMVPNTLYAIGYLMVPLTLYGTGIIWSLPHVNMVSPHVICLHVLYDSYGPPEI